MNGLVKAVMVRIKSYENFEDWLKCYQETYDECGVKHSEHWACYMLNDGCDDPFWYDCFWNGENSR